MTLKTIGAVLVLLLGLSVAVSGQDNTTLLAYFLRDLRAGTLGTLQAISRIRVGDGSASVPSYAFANDTNGGIYRISDNIFGIASNGGLSAYWQSGAFVVSTLGFDVANTDVSLSRGAANRLDWAAGDSAYIPSGGLGVGVAPSATSFISAGAGTTTIAPLTITNGTLLTNAAANVIENDGTAFYQTTNTTNGRAYQDGWNYFRLTGSGTGITTIADFFGATGSGIPLVANGVYEIEWYAQFSQATAGTATWTIVTATTALASLTGRYDCTNIAGIGAVGAPQQAGINVTSSSSTAFPVTGSMANAATHQCAIKVMLQAGNGSSNTRLRLTMSAGTATPLINSYFRVRQLPAANTGAFVS